MSTYVYRLLACLHSNQQVPSGTNEHGRRTSGRICCFSAFLLKIFTNTPLIVFFQKINLDLGAVTIGTKLTRLGAKAIGVEVQGHFLRVVDVAAYVARTWHELGAVDLGAKLDANYYGAELWKLINFNFYHDLDIEKCGGLTLDFLQ